MSVEVAGDPERDKRLAEMRLALAYDYLGVLESQYESLWWISYEADKDV